MDEHVWEELEELSRAELDEATFGPDELKDHQTRHAARLKMSPEEYRIAAETLSETPGNILEDPIQVDKVYGYRAQNGRKYKFVCVEKDEADLVAYVGDDINGTIKTFYRLYLSRLLQRLNPYLKSDDVRATDMRYKCDLDGGLKGFKAIKPDLDHPNSYSPKDCKEIRRAILNREHLRSRYPWKL